MSDGTVFSAAGVWPLLAFLSDGAAGAARSEPGEALGLPASRAAGAARKLLDGLAGVRGLDSALGLWTWRTDELRNDWAAGLPAGTHGVLTGDEGTDRRTLDAWAAKHTGGQIDRMPVTLQPNTVLVLATALALRTDWEVPFKSDLVPWRGDDRAGLTRTTPDLDSVAVVRTPSGAVTVATVRGTDGPDVLLLLGDEELGPGEVIGASVEVLAGTRTAVPGSRLPLGQAGPGLLIQKLPCPHPEPPSLRLDTIQFALVAEHDLAARPELFGLATAADGAPGHFPGISAAPLGRISGQQSATASFGARGSGRPPSPRSRSSGWNCRRGSRSTRPSGSTPPSAALSVSSPSTATPGSSSRRAGSPTRSPSARTTSRGPARTAAPTNRYARCPARRCRSPGASTHRSRPPRRH